ncbi:aminoglycoside adenylyltransferase domain-containing protein [Nocardia wallacei]|uniref:aminoglycoside adenylyltransferase domain-containing protein n=1 Tax=Nocardia wallacei TaxID=480035 RepID=UPI00245631F1|nr:aminoglycoside adenylyltransferase domain-containing protein [Nocardia wallacei]
MAYPLAESPSLPAELRPYLAELVRRTHEVCGGRLVSVFAVGSVALDDYRHERSDVDVTVIAEPALPARAVPELAAALSALDCPAAGLELVLYDSDFASRPSGAAGFRLNLNCGPLLPYRADFDSSGAPAFWFVIDRAIACQSGRLLYGRPVPEVLAAPTRSTQLAAVRDSVRAHAQDEGHLADNQVLNGCRAVVFCRTGRWVAKSTAAQQIAESDAAVRPLVEEALRSFGRPRTAALSLPHAEVRQFLSWVREHVEDTP